jgi:16S rRNA U516 pseudouridylate synthase RsuA-like enzyme
MELTHAFKVRRMCKAVKLKLRQLHRERIGNLTLTTSGRILEVGEVVEISPLELEPLWSSCGGHPHLYVKRIVAILKV